MVDDQGVMMKIRVENKNKMVFGMLAGVAYALFGVIQIIVALDLELPFISALAETMFIPKDIVGGFILVLIGVVFVYGLKELHAGINEGVAYIYVGIFFALIFLAIYLLIIAANAMEAYMILNPEFATWSPADDLKPGIYLGIIPLLGFILWHGKFQFGEQKRPGT